MSTTTNILGAHYRVSLRVGLCAQVISHANVALVHAEDRLAYSDRRRGTIRAAPGRLCLGTSVLRPLGAALVARLIAPRSAEMQFRGR